MLLRQMYFRWKSTDKRHVSKCNCERSTLFLFGISQATFETSQDDYITVIFILFHCPRFECVYSGSSVQRQRSHEYFFRPFLNRYQTMVLIHSYVEWTMIFWQVRRQHYCWFNSESNPQALICDDGWHLWVGVLKCSPECTGSRRLCMAPRHLRLNGSATTLAWLVKSARSPTGPASYAPWEPS